MISPVPGRAPPISSSVSSACLVRTLGVSSIGDQGTGLRSGVGWRRQLRLSLTAVGPCRWSFASFGIPGGQNYYKGCDRDLKVVVKDPEEFEQALREFRRKVQEQGLVREMRRRAHYVPPAEARKIKSLRARRRRTR